MDNLMAALDKAAIYGVFRCALTMYVCGLVVVLTRAICVELEIRRDRIYRETHMSSVWMKCKLPEYLATPVHYQANSL